MSPRPAGLALVVVAVLLALPAAAAAPWRPHVLDAAAWAASRQGDVAFSVRAGTRAWGRRETRTFASVSVLKPMLMVAFLRSAAVRERPLRRDERVLLTRMITRSEDPAANA